MRAASWLLATLAFVPLSWAEEGGVFLAPSYSAASIVNSATNIAGALAPNTIATIYGENLAYTTRAISPDDLLGGDRLPTALGGAGVRVLINNLPACLYFVSPQQVNLLIPGTLTPGPAKVQLILDGRAGPAVYVKLKDAAPALFPLDVSTAIATRADGSLVSWDEPAQPRDIIVLYATGLGRTVPDPDNGEILWMAAPIQRLPELRVLLDGTALDSSAIAYAGVTPGYAGLYQINLWLPESVGIDPEIRVALGGEISPAGIRLPVSPR